MSSHRGTAAPEPASPKPFASPQPRTEPLPTLQGTQSVDRRSGSRNRRRHSGSRLQRGTAGGRPRGRPWASIVEAFAHSEASRRRIMAGVGDATLLHDLLDVVTQPLHLSTHAPPGFQACTRLTAGQSPQSLVHDYVGLPEAGYEMTRRIQAAATVGEGRDGSGTTLGGGGNSGGGGGGGGGGGSGNDGVGGSGGDGSDGSSAGIVSNPSGGKGANVGPQDDRGGPSPNPPSASDPWLPVTLVHFLEQYAPYFLDVSVDALETAATSIGALLARPWPGDAPVARSSGAYFNVDAIRAAVHSEGASQASARDLDGTHVFTALQRAALQCVTSVLIDMQALRSHRPLFIAWVEVLLEVAADVNGEPHHGVRGMACLCLRELEACHPLVLSRLAGTIGSWVNAETTPVFQAYAQLASTVLVHVAQAGGSMNETHTLVDPACLAWQDVFPFVVPEQAQLEPGSALPVGLVRAAAAAVSVGACDKAVAKPVRDIVSLLVSTRDALMPAVAARMLAAMAVFIPAVGFPVTSAAVGATPFQSTLPAATSASSSSYHVSMLHHGLWLQDALSTHRTGSSSGAIWLEPQVMQQHLQVCTSDPWLSVQQRCLLVRLLLHLPLPPSSLPLTIPLAHRPASRWHESVRDVVQDQLFGSFRTFFPTVFDPLIVKEAKLGALLQCFRGSRYPAPANLMKVLLCVAHFRSRSNDHALARAVFRVFRLILTNAPQLFRPLYRHVLALVLRHPKFIPNVVHLLRPGPGLPSATVSRVLGAFAQKLQTLDVQYLVHSLPLMERIMRDESIKPTPLLDLVHRMLRGTKLYRHEDWRMGNCILNICREAVLHHPIELVLPSCRRILALMARHHADVELCDRATCYHAMFTHVSQSRLRAILTDTSCGEDEEGAATSFAGDRATAGSGASAAGGAASGDVVRAPHGLLRVQRHDATSCAACHASGPGQQNAQSPAGPVLRSDHVDALGQDASADAMRAAVTQAFAAWLSAEQAGSACVCLRVTLSHDASVSSRGDARHGKGGPDNAARPSSPSLDKAFAVVLSFDVPVTYAPLHDVRVPVLYRGHGDHVGAPWSHCFDVVVHPKAPIPHPLSVSATFNNIEGSCVHCAMDALPLHLGDFLLPMPLMAETNHSAWLGHLFTSLWNTGVAASQSLGERRHERCVRQLQVAHGAAFFTWLRDHAVEHVDVAHLWWSNGVRLDAHASHALSAPQQGDVCWRVGAAYMPPQYHVLFIVASDPNQHLVYMVTDYSHVLAFVDSFLAQ